MTTPSTNDVIHDAALHDAPLDEVLSRALALDLSFSDARVLVERAFERHFVKHALRKHAGNVSRAAAACGVSRRYFQIVRGRAAAMTRSRERR